MPIRELSFVSQAPVTSLPYTRYRLQLNTAVNNANLPKELGKLANKLKWQYKLPILSDPSKVAILSPIRLPSESEQYTILEQEKVNLAEFQYQRFFFQVCNFALFRAFESASKRPKVDRYRKRIYSPSPPANLSGNGNSTLVESQRYLTFDFVGDRQQHLVLILDFASEYRSRLTIDELGIEQLTPGQKLVQTYDGKSCEFLAIEQETISTPLAALGNNSVVKYHQQKGNIPTPLPDSLDLSTPIVKVRYSGAGNQPFEAAHMPQLLHKLYDRTEVDDQLFNQQLLSIAQKVETATKTINFINTANRFNLNGISVKFSDSLREPENLQFFLSGSKANNLNFGQGSFAYPSAALKQGFLIQKPEEIKTVILYPHTLESSVRKYDQSLKQEFDRFGINLRRDWQSYNPDSDFGINKVCQQLRECDCVIAFVPESEHQDYTAEVNPYKIIKTQLVRRKIPSQMINYSTLNQGWNSYVGQNLVLGINAKLGYLSWQLREMPGAAQAFLGLDIGRKNNRAVGASAFVLDAHGQLIGWSNAELRAYQETFDTEGLRNLLLDLLSLYQSEYQRPLKHIVIHRDGELCNPEYELLVQLKSELRQEGLEMLDVVEVIKSGTCRAVDWNEIENKYVNPDKGYAWEHCANQAVILTTGKREAKVSTNSSPRPLRIRRRIGETDLLTLAEQVYWLSEMQVGSTQTIRLPITTYYADRAAERALEGLLPPGVQHDRCLWFL